MQIDIVKILRIAVGVAILLLLVWLLGFTARRTENAPQPTEVVRYDTVVVVKHDTIHSIRTILQETYKYDTIVLRDTVFVADIPQNYVDSTPDYRIDIRAVKLYGYNLDIYKTSTNTQVLPREPQTPNKQRRGRFGQSIVVGLQAGYGLGVQPATMQARFEPYVGIGITYGWGYSW